MRITYSPGQVAMLIGRAERQLEQIVADPAPAQQAGRNIARAAHHALHETVVTLIRLYREQVPGGAPVATRIAREYAKGADAQSGAPTLACVRNMLGIVRGAHELVQVEAEPASPPHGQGAPSRVESAPT